MWQTIITFLVVGIVCIFMGRKLYRTIRQAIDPSQTISCSDGCSCCPASNCDNNSNRDLKIPKSPDK